MPVSPIGVYVLIRSSCSMPIRAYWTSSSTSGGRFESAGNGRGLNVQIGENRSS